MRLDAFPSARECGWRASTHSGLGRASWLVGCAAALLIALLVAGLGAIYSVGLGGVGSQTLRVEAQERISRLLGRPVAAVIGSTGLSLDSSMLVALDIRDVDIALEGAGTSLLSAESLSFGLRPASLIRGRMELGHARIAGAALDASALSSGGAGIPPALLDGDGVISPDLVIASVFAALDRLVVALDAGDTDLLELADVRVALGPEAAVPEVEIVSAKLSRSAAGLAIEAEVHAANRQFLLSGSASDGGGAVRKVTGFELELSGTTPDRDLKAAGLSNELGAFRLVLKGAGTGEGGRSIAASLLTEEAALRIGQPDPVPVAATIRATLEEGSGKIEFEQVDIASGRSRYRLTGAIGPRPREDSAGWEPGYRYEFVSRNSLIAPSDTNEPQMQAALQVSGRIERDFSGIHADELAVGADEGAVFGTAALAFAADQAPGVKLALTVPEMSVRRAKTVWPWFAAPGARAWVMDNLFGGTIGESVIHLDVEPGFFGRGVPLDETRLQASFNIKGTRFDVAGAIPPVRDAQGRLDISGMDIDIGLDSGTVFLPSGRTVAARSGTLRIRDASVSPLIGEVDVDVSGNAGAIVEIASYDPIDVSRFISLSPGDLDGQVTGKVSATVPLQRNVPADELTWRVDLAYENLSIAQPFEGQMVSEARGTIVAEPASTRIEARAKLNGMPAEISMFEPLGEDKTGRRRNFRVEMDDKAREALVPGLSTILSGPVTVDIAMTGTDDEQSMVADLGRARLSLPWVGWSKGAGVPATATFRLDAAEGSTRISDFSLRGESFGASGSMYLDRDGLASARFSRFRLNRNDDASLAIDRKGSRYDIDVKGASLDVRSLIKRFDALGEGSAAEDTVPEMSVRVNADVKTLSGFHGETLSGVKIAYAGAGSDIDSLRVSAQTRGGAHFAIVDAQAGGNRRIELQAADAGAVLRFLDIYPNMQAGNVALSLSGAQGGPLKGHVEARNFTISNEQRLNSIVDSAPPGADRSLNEAVRRDLDVSQSQFERGFARLEKGDGYLTITDGVVRGPTIGSTFQGTLFDQTGDMNITGTFMPAYGLNRIFGEIPLIGQILGNGRDRGLIGITYRLTGKATEPKVQINPLSVVAPGIFRSIFEYR